MSKCYYILDTRGEALTAPCLGYLSAHHDGHLFEPISLCFCTWTVVTLCGCRLTSTSPCAFRRLDYFCHLANEKMGAQRSGIPCQRSSFESSSDGPRPLPLWATEVSRQRNPSVCCPQIMCSALTLEKMKSCPFWKGMLRR